MRVPRTLRLALKLGGSWTCCSVRIYHCYLQVSEMYETVQGGALQQGKCVAHLGVVSSL